MWRQERDIENLSSGRSIACLLIPHRCRRQRPSWRGTQVRRLRQAREPAREDNNPRAGGAAWGAYLDPRRQTGSGSGSRRAARGLELAGNCWFPGRVARDTGLLARMRPAYLALDGTCGGYARPERSAVALAGLLHMVARRAAQSHKPGLVQFQDLLPAPSTGRIASRRGFLGHEAIKRVSGNSVAITGRRYAPVAFIPCRTCRFRSWKDSNSARLSLLPSLNSRTPPAIKTREDARSLLLQ